MALIIHAGKGKAGSTSIQRWLASNVDTLRNRDVSLLVAGVDQDAVRISQFTEGRFIGLLSNSVRRAYRETSNKHALLESFFEQLSEAAPRHASAVLTGEDLQGFFTDEDTSFLSGLEALAAQNDVRVAYYVRPQHTAIEAAWREWGFRSGNTPSGFVAASIASRNLRYVDTYESVRRHAPSVRFECRPFRRDLLELNDPAADFARRFLGIPDPALDSKPDRSNRGLPLEVANVLRFAPPGLFWSSLDDNPKLTAIKTLTASLELPETDELVKSRRLLQSHCNDIYEPGNGRLISAFGWDIETFVPPAVGEREGWSPALFDELWKPKASEAERAALYHALDQAIRVRPKAQAGRSRSATN